MVDGFKIAGGKKLKGRVRVSGSKNSALPIMAATLVETGTYILDNVPNLKDIQTMAKLLQEHGLIVEKIGDNSYYFVCRCPFCRIDHQKKLKKIFSRRICRLHYENHVAPYGFIKTRLKFSVTEFSDRALTQLYSKLICNSLSQVFCSSARKNLHWGLTIHLIVNLRFLIRVFWVQNYNFPTKSGPF